MILDFMEMSDPKGIPRTKVEMDWAIRTKYIIPAFKERELSVELLLDYVDLKLDWYIPSVDAIDFFNFIRLCVGKEPENLNSKAQYFFIDCIFQSDEVKPYFTVRGMDFDELKGNALILSSREFSKSTLIAYLILYMADKGKLPGFGSVNFGMYVSDNMKGNVKTTMDTLEGLYLGSTYLQDQFEWTHFTNSSIEMIRIPKTKAEIKIYNKHMSSKDGKKETVPGRSERKFKVQGLGCSGGRGSRSILDRPQFAIFDDMVANERDAYSEAILESIDSTIEGDVGSSLSSNGNFRIMIGTAYHPGDPVYKRVTEGTYAPVVFPKAEVPPHGDILDKNGNVIVPAMKKEDFVSVWPDRHTFERQRKEYAAAEKAYKNGKPKKLKTINQEFYVRVISEHEKLIGTEDIRWVDVGAIKKNASGYHWYITTDYTTTNNSGSDRSGQFLWAVDSKSRWFLIDIVLKRQDIEEQYANTLRLWKRAMTYGANWCEVAIEIDGQQILHLIAFEKYAADRRKYPILSKQKVVSGQAKHNGIRSKGSGDKLWRLHLVAPDFIDGNIMFNKELKSKIDMNILLEELSMTTAMKIKSTDDGLDCVSQKALISWYPPFSTDSDSDGYNEDTKMFDGIYNGYGHADCSTEVIVNDYFS